MPILSVLVHELSWHSLPHLPHFDLPHCHYSFSRFVVILISLNLVFAIVLLFLLPRCSSRHHHHCIYTQESLRIECSPRNSISFVCISIGHYPLLHSSASSLYLKFLPSFERQSQLFNNYSKFRLEFIFGVVCKSKMISLRMCRSNDTEWLTRGSTKAEIFLFWTVETSVDIGQDLPRTLCLFSDLLFLLTHLTRSRPSDHDRIHDHASEAQQAVWVKLVRCGFVVFTISRHITRSVNIDFAIRIQGLVAHR